MEKIICTKSYAVRGVDGNDLIMSETIEGDQVVISIQQNEEKGRIATVRLNKSQFDAFFEKKYSIEIRDIAEPATLEENLKEINHGLHIR